MKELKHFRLDFRTVESLTKDELSDLIDAVRVFARSGDACSVTHLLTSQAVAGEFRIYQKRIARQLRRAASPPNCGKKTVAETGLTVQGEETVLTEQTAIGEKTEKGRLPESVQACSIFTAEGMVAVKHALEHCTYSAGYGALLRLVTAVERTITPLMPPVAESEMAGALRGDTEAMYDVACRCASLMTPDGLDKAEEWFERFAAQTGEDMSLKLLDISRRRRNLSPD